MKGQTKEIETLKLRILEYRVNATFKLYQKLGVLERQVNANF